MNAIWICHDHPKYLTSAMLSKNLLPVFMPWFFLLHSVHETSAHTYFIFSALLCTTLSTNHLTSDQRTAVFFTACMCLHNRLTSPAWKKLMCPIQFQTHLIFLILPTGMSSSKAEKPWSQNIYFFRPFLTGKFYMKHPHWCSKYNIYNYSKSQPTHL
jgi:hypothetical protein